MSITINIESVLFILAVLGCIALVFLILVLRKLSALITNIETLITQNSTNIGSTIAKLPIILNNVDEVTDNAKDITNVAVDVAADVLTAKEKVKSSISTTAAVASIIKDTFSK